VLKSGKEATVYVVERRLLADDSTIVLACKRYRHNASFRRKDAYLSGAKAFRADVPQATRLALQRAGAVPDWQGNEFSVLRRLWHAGAAVPFPFEYSDLGEIYMEFIGDGTKAAPRLDSVSPSSDQADRWLLALIEDLHVLVDCLVVHADLSPFNVLIHRDRPVIIDTPQTVAIGAAPNAFDLLRRDVTNLIEYFARFTSCPTADDVMEELMRYAPWRK
jgi:RIO kinase 1